MTQADTAKVAVWQTATVHDDTGALIATGGQWTDQATGQPITDPAYLRELEHRMAKTKGEYKPGDRVVILDDDGKETNKTGHVAIALGMNTYLVNIEDGTAIGTQPSHMKKVEGPDPK